MRTLLVSLISFALLTSCTHVQIPNVKVCAVAGVTAAGADCVHSLSDETEQLTLDQLIAMLEPQLDPPRGAAMIISSEDFTRLKTAMEQACAKLKGCTKEVDKVNVKVEGLQAKVADKKRRKRN